MSKEQEKNNNSNTIPKSFLTDDGYIESKIFSAKKFSFGLSEFS